MKTVAQLLSQLNGALVVGAPGAQQLLTDAIHIIDQFFWSEEEINARLERIMREAFAAVWETARQKGISLRTAAFVLGCERVLMAHKLRGLYP